MGNRQTHVQARSPNGDSLQLTAHETDSPILPVAQLQQLHNFRPDLVDWVKDQTEQEARHRRDRQTTVDRFVFFERVGGLLIGGAIALFGLAVAAYVALNGQPWVAGMIGGGTLVSIVTVLVTGHQPKQSQKPPETPRQSRPVPKKPS